MLAETERSGRLRRLRFRMEHATPDPATGDPVAELQAILAEDPTFAYAELLAVRQGFWQADLDAMPSFAVAFEQALAGADKARLEALAVRHPRLKALVLVAQALLGDVEAANRVGELLRAPPGADASRSVTVLHAALRPILDAADGRSLFEVLVANDNLVRRALYDANEAGLGELLVA